MVEKGLVAAEMVARVRSALRESDPNGAPKAVSDVLVEQGMVKSAEILRVLGEEYAMPVIDLSRHRPHPSALDAITRDMAVRYRVFPVELNPGALVLALSNPFDSGAFDTLTHVLKRHIEPVLAARADIDAAIARHYVAEGETVQSFLRDLAPGEEGGAVRAAETPAAAAAGDRGDDRVATDSDAPIIRLVHVIITEAFNRRASDIHFEPLEKRFRVRYRIDGVLHEVESPPKRLQLAMISRIKIMANMSIAEKRVPQDGRIQLTVGGKTIDLRVSCLPTSHGESVVMSILDKEGLLLGLPELGFFSDDQASFEKLIALPDGIILITGPTGSGKTTTLYACLNHINRPDRKIITVEEPVEYQINGINQVPVRSEIGMTFGSALRAMLRQAPNVIMIGEIRDLETAEIAINASLTGHLVFSTLHTNDAPSAVTRLIDLGIKPFLVSTALRATMAQRLVRRICSRCKEPYAPDLRALRTLGFDPGALAGVRLEHGKGCPYCGNTGFRGRMGIFELFLVNEEIQRLIYESATAHVLRKRARELGMRTMRDDGLRKVLAGQSTIEEVISTTIGDEN